MSVCRVCCVSGGTRTLFTLKNEKIIQAFDKLTKLKFQSKGRPTEICSVCYELLLSSNTFTEMDCKSQKIFSELAASGLEITCEAIDKVQLAMMQHTFVDSVKIGLQDGTTECIQITEEVSVKIERLEKPPTDSAVWEKDDLVLLEPNHSFVHTTETKPVDQSANHHKALDPAICNDFSSLCEFL